MTPSLRQLATDVPRSGIDAFSTDPGRTEKMRDRDKESRRSFPRRSRTHDQAWLDILPNRRLWCSEVLRLPEMLRVRKRSGALDFRQTIRRGDANVELEALRGSFAHSDSISLPRHSRATVRAPQLGADRDRVLRDLLYPTRCRRTRTLEGQAETGRQTAHSPGRTTILSKTIAGRSWRQHSFRAGGPWRAEALFTAISPVRTCAGGESSSAAHSTNALTARDLEMGR